MSNIIGINGSPKINKGASYNYLSFFTSKIINSNLYNQKDIKFIKKNDIIILSFPLYIDSLPSHFLNFLINLEKNKITGKNIYAICNLGFYEPKQGKIALDIINNFCNKTNNNYMGGICIGTGPIGYLKIPFINYKIKKRLRKMYLNILDNKIFDNLYVTSLIPRFVYLKCANYKFKKELKKAI